MAALVDGGKSRACGIGESVVLRERVRGGAGGRLGRCGIHATAAKNFVLT